MRLAHQNHANRRLGEPPPEPASSLQLKLRDTLKPYNTAKMVINPTYLAQRTRSCM
jgi:NADH dehydrogenase (ubiquinone) 1 alpha subcomplex subunit 6